MLVAHVTASDGDLSSNAEIRYQVVEESGSFTVHPTGEVVSLGGFDRAERWYDVIILATDGGEPPEFSHIVKVTIWMKTTMSHLISLNITLTLLKINHRCRHFFTCKLLMQTLDQMLI